MKADMQDQTDIHGGAQAYVGYSVSRGFDSYCRIPTP
jgi:hypothetical protein